MAARMPDVDYESLKKHVDELDPDDRVRLLEPNELKYQVFKEWAAANELRHRIGGSGMIFLKTMMYC